MARTYWAQKGNDWEFLGAFRDGHKADPKQPQGRGHIIDIQDLPVQGMLDRLGGRVMLVGIPSAIGKRLQSRVPANLSWAQIEGYVK